MNTVGKASYYAFVRKIYLYHTLFPSDIYLFGGA